MIKQRLPGAAIILFNCLGFFSYSVNVLLKVQKGSLYLEAWGRKPDQLEPKLIFTHLFKTLPVDEKNNCINSN